MFGTAVISKQNERDMDAAMERKLEAALGGASAALQVVEHKTPEKTGYQMVTMGSIACQILAQKMVKHELAVLEKGGDFLWPFYVDDSGERQACMLARVWKFQRELRNGKKVLNDNCGRFYVGNPASFLTSEGDTKHYVAHMEWLDETNWAKFRGGKLVPAMKQALLHGYGVGRANEVKTGGPLWEEDLARSLDSAAGDASSSDDIMLFT